FIHSIEMSPRFVLLLLLLAVAALSQDSQRHREMKRFYSWEAKRSVPLDEESIKEKRKFYAWAGKRSGPPLRYWNGGESDLV
ncbi:hypothetical protein PENTCL1PPCAC_11534, partial [Pristionchus entomophagus]